MREIEFRGKRISDNKLVYGQLRCAYGKDLGRVFIYNEFGLFEVYPEYVGQFTGLLDKNGKKIFEGDVLKGGIYKSYIVKWDNEENGFNVNYHAIHYEIIGNVHNNPELLK